MLQKATIVDQVSELYEISSTSLSHLRRLKYQYFSVSGSVTKGQKLKLEGNLLSTIFFANSLWRKIRPYKDALLKEG